VAKYVALIGMKYSETLLLRPRLGLEKNGLNSVVVFILRYKNVHSFKNGRLE
jgi:hypothetical protein